MRTINEKKKKGRTAKELAFLAVFTAILISVQLALSFIPGVELVTVLFFSYAFVMGKARGTFAATAFSMLRQIVFGVAPNVLALYLIYYNACAIIFGSLGEKMQTKKENLVPVVVISTICTVGFSMLDNVITPLWYGYSARAAKLYFTASLPFMIPQTICAAVSVAVLFLPLTRVFSSVERRLR